ncbi:MAG: diaminopimelate decarboxylase [Candidatus Omnitrophica bacterium]|nr:diaminopimelate decarboxylase [Candidatus Omnitrophota bacterium]MDD5672501.1 diaminopimelate decarboxylase [Candidatus Omnitrophota bacterium]
MHDFTYKNNQLYCEHVRVSDIVSRVGTPAYIYSRKTFMDHIRKIQKAFRSLNPLICFSMKANSNLAILRTMVREGAGLDIVSGGELYRAKRVQCPPGKIVFAGVGKTENEIRDALRYGILFFNVESIPELELIQKIAGAMRRKARVSLRINPDVDSRTHHYVTTGKKETKFGLDLRTAEEIFSHRDRYPALEFCAIHVHIGSQIVIWDPFVQAFKKVLAFTEDLERMGGKIRFLNLGGGWGAVYHKEKPQTADQLAKKIAPLFKGRRFELVFEPGRFISANGGILVTRTTYVKQTPVRNFAIVDAGMNDLIRPSLYDAYHEICPLVRKSGTSKRIYDVVGPICESGDFLAKGRTLQKIEAGDYLAVMSAGAYGFTMSSNYNSRPRSCEVLVDGRKFKVVRKRETYASLVAGEAF